MSSLPVQDGSSKGSGPSRNIFEDPAIAAAGRDDPFVQFVSAQWKRILAILCAIGISMVAYNTFNTTRELKKAAATELFGQVREQYESIVMKQAELSNQQSDLATKSDADKKDSEGKIAELVKEIDLLHQKTKLMIVSLDSPAPFDLLGRLYGGLLAARFGEYETTKAALIANQWEIVGRAGSSERFAAEMATLGLGKALTDSEPFLAAGKAALFGLAERGEFAAVPAAVSLSSMAVSAEEKTKVRELLTTLRGRFPSQEKFISEAGEYVRP